MPQIIMITVKYVLIVGSFRNIRNLCISDILINLPLVTCEASRGIRHTDSCKDKSLALQVFSR